MSLPLPCPSPPSWTVDWDGATRAFPVLAAMAGCPQDPLHHGEGDVLVHTRMVCEELAASPAWRDLPEGDRLPVFIAALLHDAAKPEVTREDPDGRLTARGHARRGAILARKVLWRMGIPFGLRERIASLVRHHQAPYLWALRADIRRPAIAASMVVRCDHLALLAEADVRGRACADRDRTLETVALFGELCREEGCWTGPRPFPSDHARFLYFRKDGRHPDAPAHEAFPCEAVLMSGLPGAGKDAWIRENLPGWPAVSLDGVREEIDVGPEERQGAVVERAREIAREHLRARRSFAWNGTSVSRQIREICIRLFASYGARIRIAYVEVPEERLLRQNRERPGRVPEKAIERLLDRWEVPDITEAHEVVTRIGE